MTDRLRSFFHTRTPKHMTDTLHKHHPLSANGIDDENRNTSGNPGMKAILETRLNRRTLLKGGFALATTTFLGVGQAAPGTAKHVCVPLTLGFQPVAKSRDDLLHVPPGYTAKVLYRLGDPIDNHTAAFANDGSDLAASFEKRAGDHHDGMHYFSLADHASGSLAAARGLLCLNHENITQIFLHSEAEVSAGFPATGRVAAQIDKEVHAHGLSVIEVEHKQGEFRVRLDSTFNRRITAATPMELHGPVRGDVLVASAYSPDGTQTRGTLNNCANGHTPWGTYLSCEENWAGYFKRPDSSHLTSKQATAQKRYLGGKADEGVYGWANPVGGDRSGTGLYRRWDITPSGQSAGEDFRNAANTMGWVVEVDPYQVNSTPRKRTALGRFAHEGAMPARVHAGKPLVYYMGDDARGEYIFKFVSSQPWDPADATGGMASGDKYLNAGKLYAARFDADGHGEWLELSIDQPRIAHNPAYAFSNQADVLIHCRLAADAMGATPMDRPEWADVHPVTGEIYVTLTNNTGNRGNSDGKPLDAANPRYYTDQKGKKSNRGNVNGHIIRIRESGDEPGATRFTWDIYLFAAESGADPDNINVSGLTDVNDFSSPDGLWFSHATPGLMWLQTDDGAYTDVSNCMMLAALPGRHGDGQPVRITSHAVPIDGKDWTLTSPVGKPATPDTLRRFLVGPRGCEITGICETPDGRALFVNIQHPGEDTLPEDIGRPQNYQSHWPGRPGLDRPRSATLVITRDDGGPIGL